MIKPEKITSCSFGNGLCIYKVRKPGTNALNQQLLNVIVAHISVNRKVEYKDIYLTKEEKYYIEYLAKMDDRNISTSQIDKIFNTRPNES